MADVMQAAARPTRELRDGMILVPGGTFRMGSDKHYPEERRSIASPSMRSGSTARR
jgi:formylglycine-generating enzyme required for sulfatase activity